MNINPAIKRGVVVMVILFLIYVVLIFVNLAIIESREERLLHSDHVRILAGCRELIANRASFGAQYLALQNDYDSVELTPPFPANFPHAILELHAKDVLIRKDNVLINVCPNYALGRVCLLGFSPGAKQYGTIKYIDGLYYWNGNINTNY
jgi:hypothetical protein